MPVLDLEGRVAVGTGAGNGLGRNHALALAVRGERVVVNDLRRATDGSGSSADPAQALVAEIEAAGGHAVAESSSVAPPSATGGKTAPATRALPATGGRTPRLLAVVPLLVALAGRRSARRAP